MFSQTNVTAKQKEHESDASGSETQGDVDSSSNEMTPAPPPQ